MKYRITFEVDPDGQATEVREKEEKPQGNDPWRFGEIRETLWGKGPGIKLNTDLYDLTSTRKTLWGR